MILEARGRLGGRAWTDSTSLGMPLDMGCAWLHFAETNPWAAYAREHGFSVIERSPMWRRRIGRDVASETYQRMWRDAFERNEALIAEAARADRDVPVSEIVPDDEFRPAFDAVMGWLMGVDTDKVSSLDYYRYGDSEINWSITEGLGAVIAHAGRGLDVRRRCAVRSIDYSGPKVILSTDAGEIAARTVIVTVPTSVLAAGSIRFTPDMPVHFQEAFSGIPLGAVNKVFFEMAPGTLPFDGTEHFIGTDRSSRTGAYATYPAGQPALMAFIGGGLSWELEQRGELEIFARDELSGIFGSDLLQDITRSVSTSWGLDPWSMGAYSAALPGMARMRERLSDALSERIFFAGEACSLEYFGTVGGAWVSAVAAAEKALQVVGAGR